MDDVNRLIGLAVVGLLLLGALLTPDPEACRSLASAAYGFDLHRKELPGWTWPLPKLQTGRAIPTGGAP